MIFLVPSHITYEPTSLIMELWHLAFFLKCTYIISFIVILIISKAFSLLSFSWVAIDSDKCPKHIAAYFLVIHNVKFLSKKSYIKVNFEVIVLYQL